MGATFSPEAPRGLVRSLQGLFAGEPAEPVRLAEGASSPGETDPLRRAVSQYLAAVEDAEEAVAVDADAAEREGRTPPGAEFRDLIVELAAREERAESVADAVERLVRSAADGSVLELARDLASPEVAAHLVAALTVAARDEARREQLVDVMSALGSRVTHKLAEALAEAQDRGVRRAVMDALAGAAARSPQILTDMLLDRRWFVVRNAVTVMGEVGGKPAVEHLTRALAHEHERVRREAVMALARIGGTDSGQLILGMLDDPADGVRAAAAMALGVLGFERALRPLLAHLHDERSADVQQEVLRALGQLGDPGAVHELEKFAEPSFFSRTSVPVRIAAYRALAAIGTPHARKVLEAGLGAKEPEIRNAVRAALRDRG
jgi:hypothetical protein